MTLYDKIKEYLESKEKDYTEGLNLFLMVSNHRSLALYLQRKKNAEKLEYELNKLLKNLPAKLQKIRIIMPEKAVADESNDNRTSENEGTGAPGTGTSSPEGDNSTGTIKLEENSGTSDKGKTAEGDGDDSDHKIIEFRVVRPEDLPEEMRSLYDDIAQHHKEMRSIHEKMKLAQTDEERAAFREKLINLDDTVSAGWKTIDEFMLIKLQPEKVQEKEISPIEKEPEASDIAKEISAARTYLSRNIEAYQKAEEKDKRKLFEKIEKRIKILNDNKASVSKKTKKALIDLGIITKSSALLAE